MKLNARLKPSRSTVRSLLAATARRPARPIPRRRRRHSWRPPPRSTRPSVSSRQSTSTRCSAHTKTLSADEFEGRAPGGKGEELTVNYLVDQFKKIGLKPGNTDGTYTQKVPLVGITGAEARPLTFAKGPKKQTLKWKDEVVAWTKHVADGASIDNSELVFAGYGVEAPGVRLERLQGRRRQGQDDRRASSTTRRCPIASDPTKLDPKTFNGEAMTYYGRWTYKYEEGREARRGRRPHRPRDRPGRLSVPGRAGQILGEKFDLVTPDKNMGRAAIEGWVSLDAAKKIFAMAGQDFDALKRQAIDARVPAGPAGADGVDGDQEHDAHDRLAQRARQARGQRSAGEERVRRLHGALGSPGRGRPGQRRQDL